MVAETQHFSGPLPPPDALKHYEDVCQGAANRIISMAENEQQHRHAQDTRSLKAFVSLAALGQFFGFIIGITGVLAGAFLIWSGKGIQGFGVFLTCLATLVGAYFFAKHQDAKSDTEQHNAKP